ncbi:MAG: tRNA (adenosine(37)-N6)-dimethylallyltransferase MiaA [Bacteroidetes bacterium]|nr:tRNA (adenosine(37)-N6)-dimethylallyltransferase MiaA [Bacteroidota bacterium]
MKPTLIAICGPTASGKTALSVTLAKQLGASIISSDSRQFYKEISIGTAKPTLEERENVPHYFIDSHSLETPLNAANFAEEALELIENKLITDKYIVLVGGSGLFIDALLDGFDDLPTDAIIQQKWQKTFDDFGINLLQEHLKNIDILSYNSIDIQNPHRVIRAIELFEITGKSAMELRKKQKQERPFNAIRFVLNPPRELLYERINSRVHEMISQGLIEEVKQVEKWKHLQSLNTVGYKEIFAFLENEITLEEAIQQVQQNSRRYAKRQLTWFRKNPENIWISELNIQERLEFILKYL